MTHMSSEPTTNTTTLQSIRSSCDRCRLQKLKCTVPAETDGPVPCERCTRAKVPCVFGRRRRANRLSDTKKRPALTTDSKSPSPSPGPSVGNMLATPSPTSASTAAPPDLQAQLNGLADFESEATRSANGVQPWDGLTLELHNAGSDQNVLGHQADLNDWEWLQHDFGLDGGTCVIDVDPLDPTLRSTSPIFPAPSRPTDMKRTINDNGNTMPGNSATRQRLVSLVADTEKCLQTLEEGPWQHNSSRGLDDYPVGAVLHLIQEFTAIAGPILSRAAATGTKTASQSHPEQVSEATSCGETQTTERDDSDLGINTPTGLGIDTPTTLLVLCGYMWLIRIYSTVLDHFQMHLGRLPSSTNNDTTGFQGGGARGAGTRPSLQLGELPCASAAPSLGRIHTAVCMMLTALQGMDEQLGRGGTAARNMVVTGLAQEAVLRAGEFQDGFGGLGAKVWSVKELLRNKMGL
ncbi:putative transcriptional regulator LovE [Cytospora mali]|uniref:Transcriptional regulator LovE n=1 Tax=Cytospora mali TaxID=578113 RepID=A0A194UXJ0_CYTMA|nr:putative transcriptional regulator LovE [Valsa mali var. pyri (nom. inval.)]